MVIGQVTHHLVRQKPPHEGEDAGATTADFDPFGPVKALVAELGRVVKPGGALLIQTQTPEQHRKGFWWADIIPVAVDKLARRFVDVRYR